MVCDRFDGTDFAASSDPQANLVEFAGPAPASASGPARHPGHPGGRGPGAGLVLAAGDRPGQVDAGRPVLANQRFASLTINQRLRRGSSYTVVSQVPEIEAADLAGPVDYRDYPELRPYTETGSLDTEVRERARAVVGPRAPTPPSSGPWPSRTTCAATSSATT